MHVSHLDHQPVHFAVETAKCLDHREMIVWHYLVMLVRKISVLIW